MLTDGHINYEQEGLDRPGKFPEEMEKDHEVSFGLS